MDPFELHNYLQCLDRDDDNMEWSLLDTIPEVNCDDLLPTPPLSAICDDALLPSDSPPPPSVVSTSVACEPILIGRTTSRMRRTEQMSAEALEAWNARRLSLRRIAAAKRDAAKRRLNPVVKPDPSPKPQEDLKRVAETLQQQINAFQEFQSRTPCVAKLLAQHRAMECATSKKSRRSPSSGT